MGHYLFRFPASTPELAYAGLFAYIVSHGGDKAGTIGTTVTLNRYNDGTIHLRLYSTTLAVIAADRVEFKATGDHHQATREWLTKIIRDNDLGASAWRGRDGVLCIDGDPARPVEGHTFSLTS